MLGLKLYKREGEKKEEGEKKRGKKKEKKEALLRIEPGPLTLRCNSRNAYNS